MIKKINRAVTKSLMIIKLREKKRLLQFWVQLSKYILREETQKQLEKSRRRIKKRRRPSEYETKKKIRRGL